MTDASTPSPEEKRRRVLIRLVGAPILIAVLAGLLWVDHWSGRQIGLHAIVALLSLVALHELYAMMRLKGMAPDAIAGLAALALLHVGFSHDLAKEVKGIAWARVVPLALVFWVLLSMVARHGRFSPADAGGTLLGVAWIALGASLVAWRPGPHATWWLVFLFAANKGSDMAAYSAGKLIGRHKLAPVVSPNKTWEGAIAGLVVGGGLAAWVLLGPLRSDFRGPAWGLVLMALTTTVAAQLGDLVKSSVKRWAGVKDSGRLLPEFGGALDMIDTFLLSAPVAFLFRQVLK